MMSFKEVEEAPIMFDEELEDTACSYFKEFIEADLIDSKELKVSRFLKKRKTMNTTAKRNILPTEFFVKKAECSSNNVNKLEDNYNHESGDDEQSVSPVPKRRKMLTAPAYFAILSRKKKISLTHVNETCHHKHVEDNYIQSSVWSFNPDMSESDQSSVGSFNPDMSEYEDDSDSYKIKKKRLTAPEYRKLFKKCDNRIKNSRDLCGSENVILISDS